MAQDHPAAPAVNPGASLFFAGSDSALPVRHAGPDRAGYADIAARSGAGVRVARPARSPSGSRFARDRTGCRQAPAGDSGRKEKTGPRGPCSQRPRDGPPRPLVRYCPRNRAQHGSGHGADVNLAVWVGAMPPFPDRRLPIRLLPSLSAGSRPENPPAIPPGLPRWVHRDTRAAASDSCGHSAARIPVDNLDKPSHPGTSTQ
jgi:hypothetical protein